MSCIAGTLHVSALPTIKHAVIPNLFDEGNHQKQLYDS